MTESVNPACIAGSMVNQVVNLPVHR